MPRFARAHSPQEFVGVRIWPWRHPVLTSLLALALIGGAVVMWAPWHDTPVCGAGLSSYGSPYVCVGLDQDSTPMRAHDPLVDLEKRIAAVDAKATGPFATIVLLEDMTPDSATDSVELHVLRHGIEGAITAVEQVNAGSGAGGGTIPKIKLLLANFAAQAGAGQQAQQAVEDAPAADHVVAVAGIGQSLDSTRTVIENLSAHGITTVGAEVTADDLNVSSSGQVIQNFFRVSPTNADQAKAAAQYIRQHLSHQRILLVQDDNTNDIYAQTLASAFKSQFTPEYTETFQSPDDALTGVSRQEYMAQQFAGEHGDICADQPDLIYFAGRGVDLGSFLEALDSGGECPLGSVTIMTGDDANTLVGQKLPGGPFQVNLLFTSLATTDEWPSSSTAAAPGSNAQLLNEEYQDYQKFATAFAAGGFTAGDLADGQAIMMGDAVLTETTAIRRDASAVADPSTVGAMMLQLRCRNTVPGAGGFIAFDDATHNPVDKVMVIMKLGAGGEFSKQALEWPNGSQIDYFDSTC